MKIVVKHADGDVCKRCRMIKTDIGDNGVYENLCSRCADIVKEEYPETISNGLED